MYAEEYSDVMEQSVEEERRQAEELAEHARIEAEAAAAEQALLNAEAAEAAADAGAEEGVSPLAESEMTAETISDANSEPVVVSGELDAPADVQTEPTSEQ